MIQCVIYVLGRSVGDDRLSYLDSGRKEDQV